MCRPCDIAWWTRGALAALALAVAAGPGMAAAPALESRPLGVPAASADRAAEPRDREAGGFGDALRTVLALATVLAAIGGLAYGVRRIGVANGGLMAALGPSGRAPSGVLSVLGRYPVGRGQTLVLLRLEGRVLLLCQTHGGRAGGGMSTLCEVTDPEEIAALVRKTAQADENSSAGRFRSSLRRAEDLFRAAEPGAARGPGMMADYPPPVRVRMESEDADTAEVRASLLAGRGDGTGGEAGPRGADGPRVDPSEALRRRLEALRGRAAGGAA